MKLAADRRLGVEDLLFIRDLLQRPRETVGGFLTPLREASRFVGEDASAFSRFVLLVCENRGLVSTDLLATALDLATSRRSSVRVGSTISSILLSAKAIGPLGFALAGLTAAAALGLAGNAISKLVAATARQLPNLGQLSRSVASLDFLTMIAGDQRISLMNNLEAFCQSEDSASKSATSAAAGIVMDLETIWHAASLDHSANYTWSPVPYAARDQTRRKLWNTFLFQGMICQWRETVLFVGDFIDSLSDIERRNALRDLLLLDLERAFNELEYPGHLRGAAIDDVLDVLLRPYESRAAPLSSPSIPTLAPAIWRDDKQAGDTPVDFIRRHYAEFLRSDATGLSRPDLKRLDPSLYMALANWLRSNQLPDDCPIPTKSAAIDATLSAAPQDLGEMTAREYLRRESARKRRSHQSAG